MKFKLMVKHKIIGVALIAALLPVLMMSVIFVVQKEQMATAVSAELDVLSKDNLSQTAVDVYNLCQAANELIQQQVDSNLNVARAALNRQGAVVLSSETVTWESVNQYTGAVNSLQLPRMLVGGDWLGQNNKLDVTTPVIDEVEQLVGGTVTIFQRMNEAGDMLRVATNVETVGHTRAIGTYIPAVNPDGVINPIVSTIMRGEMYHGRAYVVNAWYLTAYEPLKDAAGQIIGMLYVGVKQDAVESLRQAILDIEVGESGYVYVLGGTGDQQGRYIISNDGARDGEDIWEMKDADGRLFVQSIVNKALVQEPGQVAYETYPWQNAGETEPRTKIAAITYFEPWDWVIGVGSYEEDFYAAHRKVDSAMRELIVWFLLSGAVVLFLAATIALFLGGRVARPIEAMTQVANGLALGDIDQEIFHTAVDETGQLADAFRRMIAALQAKSHAAGQLAAGDLSVSVPVASEKDVLGQAMTMMKERVSRAIEAIGWLVDAAVAGQLDTRADVSRFEGDYAQIVSGMNAVLDAIIQPLTIAVESLNKFARGDLSMPINGDFAGDYAQIKDSVNAVIAMLKMRNQDIQRLLDAAADGRLNERVDTSRYAGANGKVLDGINRILDATAVPMKDTSRILAQVANGDLTVKMNGNYRGDYAILSNSTREMITGLRGMAEQMQGGAVNITTATAEILASSRQMVGVTQEQAGAVNQITSTIEEIRISAEQVAQHAQGVANAANDATQAARRGNQAADETIDGMDDIRQKVESIAENILSLSEQMQQIGNIIDTVTDIADQSNILALNAAIEAAQAGEAGKGFRVVADEVRSLAEQSRQAAGQVKVILGDIQKATNLAVMATEQGTKGVDAGTAMVNRTAQTIRELAGTVDISAQAAQQIVAGVQQQMVGLDQIAIGMGDINMATQQTAAGAQQSEKAADDLNTLADQLKEIAVRYKL